MILCAILCVNRVKELRTRHNIFNVFKIYTFSPAFIVKSVDILCTMNETRFSTNILVTESIVAGIL